MQRNTLRRRVVVAPAATLAVTLGAFFIIAGDTHAAVGGRSNPLSVNRAPAAGAYAAFHASGPLTLGHPIASGIQPSAAGAPPLRTYGAAKAARFATGLRNPTSFAWGDGAMFAGDSGNSSKLPNGGVYIVKAGTATEIPNGPLFVGGMAWHDGALYLSAAFLVDGAPSFQIDRWSGFDGTDFTQRQILYTAPKGFQGFNGLAFGPDGRVYVGVDAGLLDNNDHGPATLSPHLYDILSMRADGKDVRVFASGIRQPWQIAFSPGSRTPFVSDLGQDGPRSVEKLNPPDFLLKVHEGQDYGFPGCNWTKARDCAADAKPYRFLAAHTDPMGLAIIGRTLYIGSFLGKDARSGGALYAMTLGHHRIRSVVTGFPVATDALAAHAGQLYVGGSGHSGGGVIYRVTP